MRFWQRNRELRRLEAELRAARHEAPSEFIRTLLGREREPRWLRPRLRIGAAVALAALALAAIASAGGMGVITEGTKAAVSVIKRTTHESAPRHVLSSAASNQYQKMCGGPNEVPCHITIFDASVREGNSGLTPMPFTVSLDATPSTTVTVDYSTSPGTAIGGASCGPPTDPDPDYLSQATPSNGTPTTLVFPMGTASETITVSVCGDTVPEPNETFNVNLCCPSPNASIVRMRATGTIVNDDH
jgi:Calx-beta domain